nr:MAG TPA: hypothetical protein [Caudoviricetes sp.]
MIEFRYLRPVSSPERARVLRRLRLPLFYSKALCAVVNGKALRRLRFVPMKILT